MSMITLLRHAESQWNAEGRFASRSDVELSKLGHQQSVRVAGRLASVRFGRVVTSPSSRAVATAKVILEHQSPPPAVIEVDERLAELDFGEFEGRTALQILGGPLSDEFRRWREGSNDGCIPGATETIHDAALRAHKVFGDLTAADGEKMPTLVVSHAHFIRILLCACVLELDPLKHRRLRLDPCGAVVIDQHDGVWRLVELVSAPLASQP